MTPWGSNTGIWEKIKRDNEEYDKKHPKRIIRQPMVGEVVTCGSWDRFRKELCHGLKEWLFCHESNTHYWKYHCECRKWTKEKEKVY